MRLENDDVVHAVQGEIEIVRSWLPWLPTIGIFYEPASPDALPRFVYREYERAFYIKLPQTWTPDTATLQSTIRHECGHAWEKAMQLRIPGIDVAALLNVIPTTQPDRGECVADIFCRAQGRPGQYAALAQYTIPTIPRVSYIDASGALPQLDAETALNNYAISQFWQRDDIPGFFRAWAQNYQGWLELHVLRYLTRWS